MQTKRKRASDDAGHASVRRVYPRFADMGTISRDADYSPRYDPETKSFDVRDVLYLAYGSKHAIKEAVKFVQDMDFKRIKWSTCHPKNAGIGRAAMPALACANLLKRCMATSPRAPTNVRRVEQWMRDESQATAELLLLDEHGAGPAEDALRNCHRVYLVSSA